jgi:branched-chain amino acid transport system ATP-binding protein
MSIAPERFVVTGLSAGYGDLRVVWNLSMSVQPGRISLLLGRNGAGKTTTLHALAGLLPDVTGSVRLGDDDVTHLPPHRRVHLGIALVAEGRRIFRKLSVEDNLRLGAAAAPRKLRKSAVQFDRAYGLFPILHERRRVMAGSLSGGQQEMLAVAQALCSNPRVLLLDEPSAGLAPAVVDELFAAITELRDEGVAVLLVEQLAEKAMLIADDVTTLESGRVIAEQTDVVRAGPTDPHPPQQPNDEEQLR